jgi:hypothetical protein
LDLVLDTFATVVALGVAVVAWVRYRETGAPVALFQASAFLVLAIASGASLLFIVGRLDVALSDFGLNMPREAQPQITAAGHLMAAVLLVVRRGGLTAWASASARNGSSCSAPPRSARHRSNSPARGAPTCPR